MRRIGIFLVIAILIVVVALIAVLVLPTLNQAPVATEVAPGEVVVVDEATAEPLTTPEPTMTPVVFVDLVIAVQELPRGIIIPENALAIRPWRQDAVPVNAVTNIEDVVGKRARTDIFREQPILTNLLVDDLTEIARVGSDAAAVLPPGLVAVALPIDRLTSVAYAPQDGDRVDLIISLLYVDIDEAFQSINPNRITLFRITDDGIELLEGIEGRVDSTQLGPVIVGPSERARPRLVTQRTIQDAFVVHVGNFPPNGRFIGVPPTPTPVPVEAEDGEQGTPPPPTPTPPRPDIITLGITPQEAVVLTWLIEARVPVTLALRSAQDTSRTNTTEVTLDYLMSQYGITLPGKRPYQIEPAIRSIRQIIAQQEIQLSDNSG